MGFERLKRWFNSSGETEHLRGLRQLIAEQASKEAADAKKLQEEINKMSTSVTTLDQAVTDLTTAVTANTAANQAAINEITTILQELQGGGDTSAAVAAIEAQVAILNQNNAALQASASPTPANPTGDGSVAS